MLKGQLSRIPWPGNSWMPFTFQPALQVPQQPHKYSHSLQLATDTELASTSLHSICFINSFWLFFKRILQCTSGHIKAPPRQSKWHTFLVYSGCHHGM